MRENSSGARKYITSIVLAAVVGTGIGAVIGAYNSDAIKDKTANIAAEVKDIPKNAEKKIIDLEYRLLPYMPGPLKSLWNWFGNIHHEKYDTLEERYEANRQNLESTTK